MHISIQKNNQKKPQVENEERFHLHLIFGSRLLQRLPE